jgi:hypothetical protein
VTTPNSAPPHLWEIDHPYYGVEGTYTEEADNFAELRESVEGADSQMNHVYRWDWVDYDQPHNADLAEPGTPQRFTVYLLTPRKSGFWSVSCPVTHDQEAEILDWLRGPRVLGALRKLWEPLLEGLEVAGG